MKRDRNRIPRGLSPSPPPPKRIKKRIKKSMAKCQQQQQQQLTHDVIIQILARLPVNTLQKFRCVCKSWNSLIHGDAYFASLHLNTPSHPKEPVGLVSLSTSMQQTSDHKLYYKSAGSKIHRLDFGSRRDYWLTNSCNGLVGVFDHKSFCVANPSIMKLRALPRGSTHIRIPSCDSPIAAMGFVASTGEYKVARLFVREYKQYKSVSIGCQVFCLGGSNNNNKCRSWKLVKDPPVLEYMSTLVYSFFINGATYWTVGYEYVRKGFVRPEVALAFDLRDENFSVILHPKGTSRPQQSDIGVLDGRLCVVDMLDYSDRMDIWVSKDDTNSKWVKQYRIDFSKFFKPIFPNSNEVRLMTVEEGRIVFHDMDDNRLIHYDPSTKRFVGNYGIRGIDYIRVLLPYTESIVWPWASW